MAEKGSKISNSERTNLSNDLEYGLSIPRFGILEIKNRVTKPSHAK